MFTITLPTTAVAQYVPATADTNGNGIPDWFEWFFLGVITNSASSDADGDGFTLLDEYTRAYNPNIKDFILDGGISQRASSLVPFVSAGYVLYRESSTPAGFVNNQYIFATNTTRVLPDVSTAGTASGYQFAEWLTNGVRVADALGRSVGGLSVVVDLTMTNALAWFFPTSQNSAGDGVPDWFKWQFYGTTNVSAALTNADGFTLLDAYTRDYDPLVLNTIMDGGISRRNSTLFAFIDSTHVVYSETSNPAGLVNNQYIVATNSTRILPDVSTNGTAAGYQFIEWRTNGVRVADALGRAVGGLPIIVTTSMTNATAVFLPTSQNTAGDGVPDWFKWQFYGTTNVAASFTNADGFTLLDDYVRDYDPLLNNAILDGGISQRPSRLLTVDTRPYMYYWVNSSPPGLVSDSAQVPVGSVVQTTNLLGGTAGYMFGHWLVNGVRQQDARGVALTQATFTVVSNTVATAFFYPLSADSNANGLPDWWEDYYFGCTTCANANADNTGTGLNNLQKYLAGLNPLDPRSQLAITAFSVEPEGWELGFQSVSGRIYRLECSADLTVSNGWQPLLDNISGDGTFILLVDPTATNAVQRFYRIGIQP